MKNALVISEIVKRYIKMRGMTIKQVADKLDMNYKTFSGILIRDSVDAKLLLRLAVLLDMDLEWISQLYAKPQKVSFLEKFQMNRMSCEMRSAEIEIVLSCLDRHIKENPDSISAVKNALMSDFNNLFYLLDVLLPEDYVIRITVERGMEKYYCMPVNAQRMPYSRSFPGRALTLFYEGNEMLKNLILDRKGEIL